LGEVKVLLVILAEYLRAGLDARALTHDEIQELSGLSRGTVNAALLGLRERLGCIHRIGARGGGARGGGYVYEPTLRKSLASLIIRPPMHVQHDHDHEQASQTLLDDMHELAKFLNERTGVSMRVCLDVVGRHPADVVRQHIEYALFASAHGQVRKTVAAYFMASIRDSWGPPPGWEEKKGREERWFTDEEYQKYFLKPGDEWAKGGAR
jgi:hypothetical protein